MSKYRVCPACDGEGKDSSRAVVLTPEDIWEAAGDDPQDRIDFVREVAALTPPCDLCKGKRVATHQEVSDWEEDLELRWEREREMRMLGEW